MGKHKSSGGRYRTSVLHRSRAGGRQPRSGSAAGLRALIASQRPWSNRPREHDRQTTRRLPLTGSWRRCTRRRSARRCAGPCRRAVGGVDIAEVVHLDVVGLDALDTGFAWASVRDNLEAGKSESTSGFSRGGLMITQATSAASRWLAYLRNRRLRPETTEAIPNIDRDRTR